MPSGVRQMSSSGCLSFNSAVANLVQAPGSFVRMNASFRSPEYRRLTTRGNSLSFVHGSVIDPSSEIPRTDDMESEGYFASNPWGECCILCYYTLDNPYFA